MSLRTVQGSMGRHSGHRLDNTTQPLTPPHLVVALPSRPTLPRGHPRGSPGAVLACLGPRCWGCPSRHGRNGHPNPMACGAVRSGSGADALPPPLPAALAPLDPRRLPRCLALLVGEPGEGGRPMLGRLAGVGDEAPGADPFFLSRKAQGSPGEVGPGVLAPGGWPQPGFMPTARRARPVTGSSMRNATVPWIASSRPPRTWESACSRATSVPTSTPPSRPRSACACPPWGGGPHRRGGTGGEAHPGSPGRAGGQGQAAAADDAGRAGRAGARAGPGRGESPAEGGRRQVSGLSKGQCRARAHMEQAAQGVRGPTRQGPPSARPWTEALRWTCGAWT